MNKSATHTSDDSDNATSIAERAEKIASLKERVRKGTYVLRTEIIIDEILSEGLLGHKQDVKEE
ncbi:MAG: hypothetical protein ACNI3A_03435 [Desulfovibrio sp.]|uniref:hypothetical protein n=1 Tax=Desulfovibrio sp. 7SRBS1 TaxID=3378064 RepID=UPI003B3D36A9